MLAGLAISPETPASAVTDSLGKAADLLLVMTVRPGRGGQKFMPECLEKVKELRERFPGKNIQVDGGVGSGNACQCAQAGKSSLFFLFYAVASRKKSDVWKRRDEKANGDLITTFWESPRLTLFIACRLQRPCGWYCHLWRQRPQADYPGNARRCG